MRESEMWPVVSRWYKDRGFRVYGDVPFRGTAIDLVAWDGKTLETGELKACLSRKVLRQGMLNQTACDTAYVVVPCASATGLEWACKYGLGVLVVAEGAVKQPVLPAQNRYTLASERESLIKHLNDCFERVGGQPSRAGEGPAIECAARVRAWVAEHRPRTWREVWSQVPNHYFNARSMAGVMGRRFGITLAGLRLTGEGT